MTIPYAEIGITTNFSFLRGGSHPQDYVHQASELNLSAIGVAVGLNALGKETELEGKKARSFPLRFVDGAVFLGPVKVAQTPPLF